MQTLLGKNNLQTIASNLYDFSPGKYKLTEEYQELDRSDKMTVDRIIFNWIRHTKMLYTIARLTRDRSDNINVTN